MSNKEYIRLSLELHLFFDRIMKEHSFFLETAFTEKNANFKRVAQRFKKAFSDTLTEALYLADGNVTSDFLESEEMVTKSTLEAEMKTSNLASSYIDYSITEEEMKLRSGVVTDSDRMVHRISTLNNETIPLVEELIEFKSDILNDVLSCKMYTFNYPLLISHILNEAKMYHMLLNKLESRSVLSKSEVYEQELFWNDIMKEHAEFIRGLLDPSEEELISTADKYAKEYKSLIESYSSSFPNTSKRSLEETIDFRNFKIAGEEGILSCKVRSIIVPLLADHVVREANHFIRILKNTDI